MQDLDIKIEQWKKRLLDLGKRNRLINFKETKRSNVGITFPNYDELFKKLVNDEQKFKFPFPVKTTYDDNGEEINIAIEKGDVETNKNINEQQKTLKVLRGRAKTSMEEQGINSLYLTFGMIRWKEREDSDVIISSPLVLVPVTLTIQSITSPYVLQLHDDEIVVNPSLAFKFENDFGIILPEFDGHEDDITKYLEQIKRIVRKNDWEVSIEVHLTLLSFLKINMYKDLDKNRDKIVSNPNIKAISGDKSEVTSIPSELNNFNHDRNIRPIDTYQVVDADSSQQDAILLSKKGVSFVLQGPPGTGKSQTITNIIAEAIADGKKVLFVSEKMAALEVVKKRLSESGLDDFCLTLHSYKANKKEVLNQLAKTLSVQKISLKNDALYKLSILETKRNKINEYQEQLHSKCPPLNISMYEANGRLAKLCDTQDIIFEIDNIENTDMEQLNKYKYLLDEFSKTIGKLSEDYSENPWYGCNVPVVTHELRHDIEVNLKKLLAKFSEAIKYYEHIIEKTGANIELTVNNFSLLSELLKFSSESPLFPINWLSEDISLLFKEANEFLKLFCEYREKVVNLNSRYKEEVFKLNADNLIFTIETSMIDIKDYLNNLNYLSNKDIVLKADFILNESKELKDFVQNIYNQSDNVLSVLGLDNKKTLSYMVQARKLVELILKDPKPNEKWFNEENIESITKLMQKAESEQLDLNNNLMKMKENYNEEIISIEYNMMLERFKSTYINVIKIIAKFMNLPNDSDIDMNILSSFTDNQVNKLKSIYSEISSAYEVVKELEDSLGVRCNHTLKGFNSLSEVLSAIIQNPKPTLAWFDENKDVVISRIISDIKSAQKEIEIEINKLMQAYNKDVLSIDYKNILIRFNSEYRSFLKVFKRQYSLDKKAIQGFNKNPKNKLSDGQIIELLNKISYIKEKEQWLKDNRSLAVEMLGDLYVDNYTNWEMIDKNLNNFKSIRNYFSSGKVPEQLKQILLQGDIENLMDKQSILFKIVECEVQDLIERIFGESSGSIKISELLSSIEEVTSVSVKMKCDYETILKHAINSGEASKATVNNIISILTSIKEVVEKRSWYNNNSAMLQENFGQLYNGEETNWNEVSRNINVTKEIIAYFNGDKMPRKLISYLLSSEKSFNIFMRFINSVEEITTKSIIIRLNDLLNINNNHENEFDKIIEMIEIIEKRVNVSQSKYIDFFNCGKTQLQFETIMSDIISLKKVQEIENIVEKNSDELQLKFGFMFEEINTNWDSVCKALNYAESFKKLCDEYSLLDSYISDVASNKQISTWTTKYWGKLTETHESIKGDFEWFANLFDNSEEFYDSSIYSVKDKLEKSSNNLILLEEWIDFRSIRQQCREVGLSEFVEKVEQVKMNPEIIVNTFFKRFYRLWLDKMIPSYPAVYAFRSRSHESTIKEFNELDKLQLDIARLRILERLISRLPDTNIVTSSFDEVGILKREFTKQRKIMPLRKLFRAIPNLLTALKPCLMMSPLSVSLFLQADGYNFDTIIFDEASQVCTEDAIGAIMRGKQVIIAGDSNQLPPTNFFSAALSDGDFDDENEEDNYDDTGAYDSILEEAINALPERTLKWHYRSRHEHLIAFSNAKIYNNELITFPSNMDKVLDNGVEYIFVEDGVYDRGGKKHNINEAKRVASLVFEHIRKYPNRSLGVVTFSESQQQAVDSAIRQLRLKNSQYEKFFSEDNEHAFFIKNLENVQGDERDTIIFSIGYAKDQNGVMYMNFGPLSKNGGHRRLNVAITRAKYNVKLVGSIHPTDIRVENTNSEGVKMLRQYIEFAINGASALTNELKYTNSVEVDSPFEEAVHDFLIRNGYNVVTQVGCSGYRIDMAVKHPTLSGVFVLGIECDGATYHSARTARERDRLRQTVLEDIGWSIYRIWSTDWIKDPKTEGTKLIEAVERAISNYKMDGSNICGIKQSSVPEKDIHSLSEDYVAIEDSDPGIETEDNNPYNFGYYSETDVYKISKISNDEKYLANVIKYVVEEECPIHFELLCRRVAILFGNQKVTIKVRNYVQYVLDKHLNSVIMKKGDFCWHNNVKQIKVKMPSEDGNNRTINFISDEEIAEAMITITGKSFGITKNDLYTITARTFGFNRSGGNIAQSMERACLQLLQSDRVKQVDGKIVVN